MKASSIVKALIQDYRFHNGQRKITPPNEKAQVIDLKKWRSNKYLTKNSEYLSGEKKKKKAYWAKRESRQIRTIKKTIFKKNCKFNKIQNRKRTKRKGEENLFKVNDKET